MQPTRSPCVVCSTTRNASGPCDHGEAVTLGEGTYGRVFLCKLPDGSCFVEKVLKVDASITHQREIQCLSHCHHPNIVRVVSTVGGGGGTAASSGTSQRRVTVRMEYCRGGDLYSLVRRRAAEQARFTAAEILTSVTQLILAVHYLHTNNILHRDIKSSNVFLRGESLAVLKLGDFGCSFKSDTSIAEDQRRTFCGTWGYIAPEMLTVDEEHKAQYGKKAETWSIGCVMFEMMNLQQPFSGDYHHADAQSNFVEMRQAVCSDATVDVLEALPYPAELKQLCRAMLTVSKDERPHVHELLKMDVCQRAGREWLESDSAALSDAERQQVLDQLSSVLEPSNCGVLYRRPCFRVRSSTCEIVPAEVRITESGQSQFRDVLVVAAGAKRRVAEWCVCSLKCSTVETDEFEDGSGDMFYGVAVRPAGFNAVTVGFIDKDAKEAQLELLGLLTEVSQTASSA